MAYKIGQAIDEGTWQTIFGRRGIWLRDAEPQWYIFTTAPAGELPAEAWLRRNGAPECWFPAEERWRRLPRGQRRKVRYLAPIVPRYLFAVLDKEPNWDVLFDRSRGKLTGVVSRDGIPMPIPEKAMLAMAQIPQRLAAIRAKQEIALRIKPGDRAEVVAGPLAGWTVDVSRIDAGIASIVMPMLGLDHVDIPVGQLRKAG